MPVAITAYEFYGVPTGNSTTVCASRTPISDMSLKAIVDPTAVYYSHDIQRSLFEYNTPWPWVTNPRARYISFRITGDYNKIKNLKITLTKPSLYQKIGGEFTAVTDDTVLTYKLTNVYENPPATQNIWGIDAGTFDGNMNVVTAETVLRPKISAVSPVLATSRQTEYVNSESYWTEFLVLQANVYPGEYNKVGNFGKIGGRNIGSITGPLVRVEIDEVGYSTVD